jgi:transposase
MPRHRSHSTDFKRQVVAEYHAGETLHALGRRHDLSRNLIRIWIEKAEAGSLDQPTLRAEVEAAFAAADALDTHVDLDKGHGRVADQRVHGTTGEPPIARFAAEAGALRPLIATDWAENPSSSRDGPSRVGRSAAARRADPGYRRQAATSGNRGRTEVVRWRSIFLDSCLHYSRSFIRKSRLTLVEFVVRPAHRRVRLTRCPA